MPVHTLKVSVSLPDPSHQDLELHLSVNGSDYDVVIALPLDSPPAVAGAVPVLAVDTSTRERDEYDLGGYAGI